MLIQCITKRISLAVSMHPDKYLPEGICTDSGCNYKALAIIKESEFSYRRINTDKQISNNIVHYLLYGLNLGIG
jgi:hypothetical protein